MMRLLLIGNFLSKATGTRGVCEDLADHLEAAGWSVIRTSTQPWRLARFADIIGTIWRRRHDYDIAHVEVYSDLAFGLAEVSCWLLSLLSKPVILTLHGGNLPEFGQKYPRRVDRLLSSAAAVTAPSHYLKEGLAQFRNDVIYLPNGIDINRYPFYVRQKPAPNLVWLRAFHQVYHPQMAIGVVRMLVEEWPNLRLRMFGPEKDGTQLTTIKLAEELGVADRVAFPGRIQKVEVPQQMNEGDIFINTTDADNTPVSVIEAMACGVCVVSTKVGGIPFLLDDESNALLVPPGDVEAMAAAVRRILTEPGLAERLSRNARAKVEQFDWSLVLPQWEHLFAEIGLCRT